MALRCCFPEIVEQRTTRKVSGGRNVGVAEVLRRTLSRDKATNWIFADWKQFTPWPGHHLGQDNDRRKSLIYGGAMKMRPFKGSLGLYKTPSRVVVEGSNCGGMIHPRSSNQTLALVLALCFRTIPAGGILVLSKDSSVSNLEYQQ